MWPFLHRRNFPRLWDPVLDDHDKLAAWFSSDLGVTADANQAISAWADQSGLGHNLLQATGAAQPLQTRTDTQGNWCLRSQAFNVSPWTATGVTFDTGITAPDSTPTAFRVNTFNGATGTRLAQVIRSGFPFRLLGVWASVYVKGEGADIGKTFQIVLKANAGTAISATANATLTADWQLITLPLLNTLSDTVGLAFTLDCPAGGPSSLLLWGASVRDAGWDAGYVATTTYPQVPGLNGKSVVWLSGATYLKTAGFTFNQPETLYLVMLLDSGILNSQFTDGNASDTGDLYLQTSPLRFRLYAGGSSGITQTELIEKRWGVVSVRFWGTQSLVQVNARWYQVGTAGTSNMGGFTLGAAAGGASKGNGRIAEVLLYSGAHNQATRYRVQQYLAQKWGLAA